MPEFSKMTDAEWLIHAEAKARKDSMSEKEDDINEFVNTAEFKNLKKNVARYYQKEINAFVKYMTE